MEIPTPDKWWQAIPAWPVGRDTQSYFALRRVWADHTMAGGRGIYRPRSEDHQTVVLFQPFAVLPAEIWLPALAESLSLAPIKAKSTQIAYMHEEEVPTHRIRYHGRDFVIADIVLHWANDVTDGLISFEVKRQDGPGPTEQDFEKARTYIEFASMRHVARRDAVFLVSDRHSATLRDKWPHVASWSDVLVAQHKASSAVAAAYPSLRDLPGLIEDLFAAYGIGHAPTLSLPDPSALFDTAIAHRVPPELAALAAGLAYSAQWRRGNFALPLPSSFGWLHEEPTEAEIRQAKAQKTPDRRVIRWSPNWKPEQERALRFNTGRLP